MNIEAIITKHLNELKDPFLNLSGEEMSLQYDIAYDTDAITIDIKAGFPTQLLEKGYCVQALGAIQTLFPDKQINCHIHQIIKAHQTQIPGKGLRGVKNTIAIASGKGGVGKSTVTINLAVALAQMGARVGILDADIYGPSIPLMLGPLESDHSNSVQVSGDFYLPAQVHGIQAMSIAYLTKQDSALIWRGPMLAKSLVQMINITVWDELDYLFIDLPPGTGDIQLTLVQKIPLTTAIVVTTPQQVATLDAQKALTMFSKTGIDVLGVVENMSTHLCSHCGHYEAIFGEGGAAELCNSQQTVLLGQLPLHSLIREHCDEGIPTVLHDQDQHELAHSFIKVALRSAIALAKKPVNYADKFPNIVVES